MWCRPLSALVSLTFLSSAILAQDLPGPGEPALEYADGAFSEPRGSQSTYTLGSTMNVSWHTTYETSNLWLIVGWSFGSPVQLASNLGQTWYEWKVSTDSTNSSEIYAFRVVNAGGTIEDQQGGGFLSAAFWIDGLPTTSISSTMSHVSTPASTPIATSTSTSSSATSQTAESTNDRASSGLSDSGKIGVGVGVGVGGVGIIALVLGVIFLRRSKNSRTQAADSMEPYSQPPQEFPSTSQTYQGPADPQLHGYYKPMEPSEMEGVGRGAELDGGQKVSLTHNAYLGDGPRSHPAELQG
ncbi:hypothetical protein F5Y11DRAFT_349274 [Daldinia sp. FL1419]|nr:hypothetical protein F5Y11DRAFT_349274 [Daldinia sp. FL1419]